MPNTLPSILKLPRELRQQIYHYTLTQDLQSHTIPISVAQRHGYYKLHGLEPIQGLILVNHTLHDEVLSYCFSRLTFALHNERESLRFVVREFYRQIGAQNRGRVTRIAIPDFSIDAVFFDAANMVSLFASSGARYCQLHQEMQGVFLWLARFPALLKVDFGIDFVEATRSTGACRPWQCGNRVEANVRMRFQGVDVIHGNYILDALGEARELAPSVRIGIWWKGERWGISELEASQAKLFFLECLRTAVAPIRVECKDGG
ncbi:hypothetical protein BDW02DRAFT_566773 [Decorospora gaudefroyi]|uniref:F-box domain-containing protein n=1 Tax=Decorospora gaudefroyi TaxID=184978 RepID=A0A6A5KM59_9PLEO|nr:hypothetical protein BDW02DRAFT_566773 [Decorospora gaudefroyi]